MGVYYNEFDKKKCAALKVLMEDGFITRGDIDDRPIQEIKADEIKGYTRAHFFAGIGLWDYAVGSAVLPACSVGAGEKVYKPGSKQRLKRLRRTVGQPLGAGSQGYTGDEQNRHQPGRLETQSNGSTWQTGIWIDCPDGKQRLVEPGIRLLANGYPNRVLQIHCAGDGIVPQVAAEFIGAYMDIEKEQNHE